jgi:multiple sugar transport system permease protein
MIKGKKKSSAIKKRETMTAWLFLIPSLTGVSIFVLLPFAEAVKRSFFEAMSGQYVGLKNYGIVLKNEAFLLAAKNTGRFIITCIPLLLLISLLLSLLVYEQKHVGFVFKTSFLVPMAIPVASVVLLWRIFFDNRGLLNVMMLSLGAKRIDWMHTSSAFYVLVFSYLWKNMGYDMVLWLAGLDGISIPLYEAASIDGAGKLKQFWYITLPGLLPTVFTLSVLSLINSFKVFREAYLIAGNYPDKSIYMLQHLFNNWFTELDIQKMCAAAVIFAAVLMVFILLLQFISIHEEDQ